MHLTIAPGIYVVGGNELTDEEDCTILLLRSSRDACVLLGCGCGKSVHAVIRNVIELGVSFLNIRYVVVPIHNRCIANCRRLLEIAPWIHIAAPPAVASKIRKGIDVEPVAVAYEANHMVFNGIEVMFEALDDDHVELRAKIDGRDVRICLTFLRALPYVLNKFRKGILCLLDATRCLNIYALGDAPC